MRKLLIVLTVLGLGAGLSTIAFAEITGSAHDFSGQTWNPGGEICQVCHTPHNSKPGITPLWNHDVTAASHTEYSNPASLDAIVGAPAGVSLLCLSCHDGTVALDSFGGATGTNMIATAFDVGTDLSDDHPISFTYNDTLATDDGELAAPSTDLSGLGGTIEEDMLFGTAGSKTVECASCHDAHGSTLNLLVKDNATSGLCLTCHNK